MSLVRHSVDQFDYFCLPITARMHSSLAFGFTLCNTESTGARIILGAPCHRSFIILATPLDKIRTEAAASWVQKLPWSDR